MNSNLLFDFTVDKENATVTVKGILQQKRTLSGLPGQSRNYWTNGGRHIPGSLKRNQWNLK